MEAFKNWINEESVQGMAEHFARCYKKFDQQGFILKATDGLELLELKQRTEHITQAMKEFLPEDFEKSAKIIEKSLGPALGAEISGGSIDRKGISGWSVMALSNYVALHGHDHFELSLELLKVITQRASAEFAIRHFLRDRPEKTLDVLETWIPHKDHHVRRLVSEGTRPKLPWGFHLPVFIASPQPVIALIDQLKDDESEYVRRSVANNLNDIAKQHPELVSKIAADWYQAKNTHRDRLLRHACRTLLKDGHTQTLQVFGYQPPKIKVIDFDILTPNVKVGDACKFKLQIQSKDKSDTQILMIDYRIHYQKANGNLSPKVFKWRKKNLKAMESIEIKKNHSFKLVTTRVYHPGLHKVEIMVNGKSLCMGSFEVAL